MKKLIFCALIVLMTVGVLISICVLSVYAESSVTSGAWGENVTWSFDSDLGEITLSGQGDIEYGYYYPWDDLEIKSVVIEEGITSIPRGAFDGHTAITEVTLCHGLESIGSRTFYSSEGIKTLVIPDTVTSMEVDSFYTPDYLSLPANLIECFDATLLKGVTFSSGKAIPEYCFANCKSLESVTFCQDFESIGNYAFRECSGLVEISIPAGVEIGEYAFYKCSGLNIADIHAKKIGLGAFRECTSLETVVFAETVESIGEYAFLECTALKEIVIPNNVKEIGTGCFMDCSALSEVTLPNSIDKISDSMFSYCTSLESIVIPESVTSIGIFSFVKCTVLKDIEWSPALDSIGDGAFSWCISLPASPQLPDSVTEIGETAFSGCTSIESFICPAQLKILGDEAFASCTNLKTVEFSQSLETIGNSTFYACGNLEDFVLPEGLKSIGKSAFEECVGLENIAVPEGVTYIGISAFRNCSSLETLTLPFLGESKEFNEHDCLGFYFRMTFNPEYPFECGYSVPKSLHTVTVLHLDTMADYAFANSENIKTLIMPDSITEISKGAFYNCKSIVNIPSFDNLTKIEDEAFRDCGELTEFCFTDTLTSIGQYAFSGTSLRSVDIPDSVQTLGVGAFASCDELVSVRLQNNLTVIPAELFSGCQLLKDVTIPNGVTVIEKEAFYGASLSPVFVIPDNVVTIEEYAFSCCEFVDLHIPASLKTIGRNTFYWCFDLENVYISDISQWLEFDFSEEGTNPFADDTFRADNLYVNGDLLKELVFPEGTTHIDNRFSNVICIESVYMPDSVMTVAPDAFKKCYALKSVRLSENLSVLESGVFFYCPLETVYIPSSVREIKSDVFGVTGDVKNVIFCGDWSKVTLQEGWLSGASNATVKQHDYELMPVDDTCHKMQCIYCAHEMDEVAHEFSEPETVLEPTHLKEGSLEYVCQCGYVKSESIEKLAEHTFGEWLSENDEIHVRSCECGETEQGQHQYSSGKCVECGHAVRADEETQTDSDVTTETQATIETETETETRAQNISTEQIEETEKKNKDENNGGTGCGSGISGGACIVLLACIIPVFINKKNKQEE